MVAEPKTELRATARRGERTQVRNPFIGRTLQVIGDFNREERLYLFRQARQLKEAIRLRDTATLERYRIDDGDFGLYEVFLEDSTRTRESFKNAAEFHRVKSLELNASSSSFNKSESYADTFANLIGYDNKVFVVRSRLEGVCRYLAELTGKYVQRHGFPESVSFINAGDGRHEHPTQELLDEFTFLEDLSWSEASIHLAMVGDLYHGRTVHSKVHGLNLFKSVTVDLISPPELAMPAHYVEAMIAEGYRVRQFHCIEEYLESGDLAPQWYFTRPQLERMGDRVLRRQEALRSAITFTERMVGRVPDRTRFYHPLPRHREHPTIPPCLDDTPLNGWERQSANGWVVRIALLALLAGKIGEEYEGPVGAEYSKGEDSEFVCEVPTVASAPKHYSEGVRPIDNGVVVDHIAAGESPENVRAHMTTVLSVVELNGRGGEWTSCGSDGRYKGIIFRPDHAPLTGSEVRRLAAVAPGATVNLIENGSVVRKYRLSMPERIYGMQALICRNEGCITHPDNHEPVQPSFRKSGESRYSCEYCDTSYGFKEIWR